MRKSFGAALGIGVIFFGFFLFGQNRAPQNVAGSSVTPTYAEQADRKLRQNPGRPKRIVISKIGIDTRVESVGLDNERRMDVPKNIHQVGWYNLGYIPGAAGSAVMSGHYDTKSGEPAVFYRLDELDSGDEIRVFDDEGASYTFRVYEKTTYPYDEVPLQKLFDTQGDATLHLITCSGQWDQASNNYSTRTVVSGKLVEDPSGT